MNMKSKTFILLLFGINLLTACANKPGIGIYDLFTHENKMLPSKGYRENIVNTSSENCRFFTWQRIHEEVVMRERDCAGTEIGKIKDPLFSQIYRSRNNYIVSKDGTEIVYQQGRSLWLFDIPNKTKKILLQKIDTRYDAVQYLEYISDNEILTVVKFENADSEDYSIALINTKTGIHKILFNKLKPGLNPSGEYAVAKKKKLFAFFQSRLGSRLYGDIVILNLETKKIVDTIMNNSKTLVRNFSWNTDETTLAYDNDNKITIYSLHNSTSKTLKILEKEKKCYYLDFISPDTILYKVNKSLPGYSIRSVNSNTGKEVMLFSSYINGNFFITNDRKKILYEYGY